MKKHFKMIEGEEDKFLDLTKKSTLYPSKKGELPR
jgi:hypothetical protein